MVSVTPCHEEKKYFACALVQNLHQQQLLSVLLIGGWIQKKGLVNNTHQKI